MDSFWFHVSGLGWFLSQYGGQELGLAAARELYGRVNIAESLESIFALADMDGNGRLGFAEFLLFMYLLKVLRKGVALPKKLSSERVSRQLAVNWSLHLFSRVF
jgi:hypothetical protein